MNTKIYCYTNKVVLRYVNFAEVVDGKVSYVNEFITTAVYELDTQTDIIGTYTPPKRTISGEETTLITVE